MCYPPGCAAIGVSTTLARLLRCIMWFVHTAQPDTIARSINTVAKNAVGNRVAMESVAPDETPQQLVRGHCGCPSVVRTSCTQATRCDVQSRTALHAHMGWDGMSGRAPHFMHEWDRMACTSTNAWVGECMVSISTACMGRGVHWHAPSDVWGTISGVWNFHLRHDLRWITLCHRAESMWPEAACTYVHLQAALQPPCAALSEGWGKATYIQRVQAQLMAMPALSLSVL
jgi:hypothetical protein